VARVGGQQGQTGERDIVAYHPRDTTEIPLLTLPYDEVSPKLSPDGRWLLYSSQESGKAEVYVRPFPDVNAGRWPISVGGGSQPLWAKNGREIFYVSPDNVMMAAVVTTQEGFQVGERKALFEIPSGFVLSAVSTPYDVSPDGQRFIMVRDIPSATPAVGAPIILVENWFEELRAKIGR
jgi:Tol biopolymer transport system component